MKKKVTVSPETVKTVCTVAGLCLFLCVVAAGCAASVDTLFTTAEAIVAGIGVVLTALGAIIPAPVAAEINKGIEIVSNTLAALKQAYDNYKNEPANKTLLGEVQNAIAAAQQSLTQFLAAVHIDNVTLQGWIVKVVSAVGAALDAVAKDIVPIVTQAIDADSLNASTVSQISASAEEITAWLEASYDASLGDLPANAAQAAHDDFQKRTHKRFGL